MGVGCVNKFTRINAEESPVIQEVGGWSFEEMAPFNQHVGTPQGVDQLGCLASLGEGLDLGARQQLGLVNIWGDEKSKGNELVF